MPLNSPGGSTLRCGVIIIVIFIIIIIIIIIIDITAVIILSISHAKQ